MESNKSLRRGHWKNYVEGRPLIKSTPLEGWAAPPPWLCCLLCCLCFLCGFWLVTRQSNMSYLRFRCVTKWATQACIIPIVSWKRAGNQLELNRWPQSSLDDDGYENDYDKVSWYQWQFLMQKDGWCSHPNSIVCIALLSFAFNYVIFFFTSITIINHVFFLLFCFRNNLNAFIFSWS